MTRPDWEQSGDHIEVRIQGRVYFADTIEHWENAVLRLLGISDAAGREWVLDIAWQSYEQHRRTLSEVAPHIAIATLTEATRSHFRQPAPLTVTEAHRGPTWAEAPDTAWSHAIGNDERFAMIGNATTPHSWLISTDTFTPVGIDADYYDEGYFEGGTADIGYGHYLEQAAWRLEKAERQIREIIGLAAYLGRPVDSGVRVLDVGSGYGFFRKAAADHGWEHTGVEISKHAGEVADSLFGFDSFIGTLENFAENRPPSSRPFDVITMWDCLEHVVDPAELLAATRRLLTPGGLLFIRTPNLLAAERVVFGSHYHSFKREHLHMFSPASIAVCALTAGLEPRHVSTHSHLLKGFLGAQLATLAVSQLGSDLLAVVQRPVGRP